jgi:hypothetical protein
LSAFGWGVGDSHQTRVNESFTRHRFLFTHSIGDGSRHWVKANEFLTQVQVRRFLKCHQRLQAGRGHGRQAGVPAVAQLDDDGAVGREVAGE